MLCLRSSPMGYTGFFVSINSLHPPPISARKLRDCSFGMLSFSFFFMARVIFFFVAVDSQSLYKEMCCMIRKLIFLATIY